jgi:hypothetical protein
MYFDGSTPSNSLIIASWQPVRSNWQPVATGSDQSFTCNWLGLNGNQSFWQPVATGLDQSFLDLVNLATGNWTGYNKRQLATAVQLPTSPIQSSCQSFHQSATGL